MRAQRLPVLPTRLRLPGRTVRVRLAATYGILFLVSGAVLLAIASGVAVARSPSVRAVAAPNQATPGSVLAQGSALAQDQARIQRLQAQLQNLQAASPAGQDKLPHQLLFASLIALAIMTVISVALGWLVAGRTLRPVREMTAAAQRISEDSLHERLEGRAQGTR
jgi:methyl-accepting chemotaxis protein